ncbi:hypothetical protein MJH12_00180 [bacterium]|nr:hypothetical protein [bacterium]
MNQQNYAQELANQNNMPLASLCLITGEITIFEKNFKPIPNPSYQQSSNSKVNQAI